MFACDGLLCVLDCDLGVYALMLLNSTGSSSLPSSDLGAIIWRSSSWICSKYAADGGVWFMVPQCVCVCVCVCRTKGPVPNAVVGYIN